MIFPDSLAFLVTPHGVFDPLADRSETVANVNF
jgi:hypothetical protein